MTDLVSSPSVAAQNTTNTNALGPDGYSWAQSNCLAVDKYGKIITAVTLGEQDCYLAYSNNGGASWSDSLSQYAILRGSIAYDSVNDQIHVLWKCYQDTDGILYRRYAITRDGSHNITAIARDANSINLQLDYKTIVNSINYQHPVLLWLNDAGFGSNGALLAVWGVSVESESKYEVRASMRVLSNTSADNTASNWVAPVSDDASTITNDAQVPYSIIASGTGGIRYPSIGRKTTGTNALDVYVAYAYGSGSIRYKRMRWSVANNNWSTGLGSEVTITNITRSGSNSGYTLKEQLVTGVKEDTANDMMVVGFATWKSNTAGDSWGFAFLNSNDTASSIVDVYDATAAKCGATIFVTGDIVTDNGSVVASYTDLANKDIYVRGFDHDGTEVQAATLVFNTMPCDIPCMWQEGANARYSDGGASDHLLIFFRDFNTQARQNPPSYSGGPYKGYFGTLDWAADSGSIAGTLNNNFGVPVLTGSGTVAITGSLSANVGMPTVEGIGNPAGITTGETMGLLFAITYTSGDNTGSLSASIGMPTLASSGTVDIGGTLSASQNIPTLAGVGSVAITGTLSASVSAPTVGAIGTVGLAGTLSASVDAPTLVASGTVGDGATLSVSVGVPTLVGSGTVEITGTLTDTPGQTLSAIGTVPISGTASGDVQSTLASQGALTVTGTLSGDLPGIIGTLSGSISSIGQLSSDFPGITSDLSGSVAISGICQDSPVTTLDASGNVAIEGVFPGQIGSTLTTGSTVTITGSATGEIGYTYNLTGEIGSEILHGALEASLEMPTLNAVGTVSISASLSSNVSAPTLELSGTVAVGGTLSDTPGSTHTATGSVSISGTLSVNYLGIALTSEGGTGQFGTLDNQLAGSTLTASGTVSISGQQSSSLSMPTLQGQGTVGVTGSLSTTQSITSTLNGSVPITGGLTASYLGNSLTSEGGTGQFGSIDGQLAGNTLTASGTVGVTGQQNNSLAVPALQGQGAVGVTGTLSVNLSMPVLGTSATVSISGSLAQTYFGVILEATGTLETPEYLGSLNQVQAMPQLSASGTVGVAGAISGTSGQTVITSGGVSITGDLSQSLSTSLTLSGTVSIAGQLAQDLFALVLSAVGINEGYPEISGVLVADLSLPEAVLFGTVDISGTLEGYLPGTDTAPNLGIYKIKVDFELSILDSVDIEVIHTSSIDLDLYG